MIHKQELRRAAEKLGWCILILAALICTVARAEGTYDAIIKTRWPDYSCVSECTPAGDAHTFLSLHKDGSNVLLCLKDGEYLFHTDNAVPQGNPVLLSDSSGSEVQLLMTQQDDEGFAYKSMCTYQRDSHGQWQLAFYHSDSPKLVDIAVYSNKLVFGGETTVYGTVQTDMRYFTLSTFPTTVSQAREKLSTPPSIPEGGEMQGKSIQFTGGKTYAVYSGPGENYLRGGSGKAVVSTNDWIQVFGKLNGWVLIQYAIASDYMRFGYIDEKALPGGNAVNTLQLHAEEGYVSSACTLTDDPMYTGQALLQLSENQQITYLSSLGTAWAYVEVGGVQPVRGFVPMGLVRLHQAAETLESVSQYLLDTWYEEAGGVMFAEILQFLPDGTLKGGTLDDNPDGLQVVTHQARWAVAYLDRNLCPTWSEPEYMLIITYSNGQVEYFGLDIIPTSLGIDSINLFTDEGSGGYQRYDAAQGESDANG